MEEVLFPKTQTLESRINTPASALLELVITLNVCGFMVIYVVAAYQWRKNQFELPRITWKYLKVGGAGAAHRCPLAAALGSTPDPPPPDSFCTFRVENVNNPDLGNDPLWDSWMLDQQMCCCLSLRAVSSLSHPGGRSTSSQVPGAAG